MPNRSVRLVLLLLLTLAFTILWRNDHGHQNPVSEPASDHLVAAPQTMQAVGTHQPPPTNPIQQLNGTRRQTATDPSGNPTLIQDTANRPILIPDTPVLKVKLEQASTSSWRDVIPQLITLAALGLSALTLWLTDRNNKRTLRQKANEDEIKDINDKLNAFYGPFRQLLGTSERLTELFKSSHPPEYRTLMELLRGTKFDGNDKVLIAQIIDVTQNIDKLIVEKSGLIDESLQPLIARASTHFRLMKLAYDGTLSGEAERFKDDVYPRQLNQQIDEEIERLRTRKRSLKRTDVAESEATSDAMD
jgi:hypothetical protein